NFNNLDSPGASGDSSVRPKLLRKSPQLTTGPSGCIWKRAILRRIYQEVNDFLGHQQPLTNAKLFKNHTFERCPCARKDILTGRRTPINPAQTGTQRMQYITTRRTG